ncbi:glycosyltransferase family 32 protein [Aquibium carbonis]|uniref:glycosyltransferase family 32 protein n=1 Tax=Aquibium carbonis TaxID=2495581 RepID=UPI0014797BE3|nr:glycosyltransferase [Aquibium carbonis]
MQLCRQSWARYCPDYEVVEWNDETFSKYRNSFFDEAIAQRKFAFASDYARALVLNEFGGIYLDTDVELRKPLDRYLPHSAFTGFERVGFPFTAVWGSEAGHPLARLVCEYYSDTPFSTITNTSIVSGMITKEFGIERDRDRLQVGKHGLAVYPSSTFCVDVDECTAVHHFAGSWLDNRKKTIPYKQAMSILYHSNRIAEMEGLASPAMFSMIRDKVGIMNFLRFFLYRSLRHYGGNILRLAGLR